MNNQTVTYQIPNVIELTERANFMKELAKNLKLKEKFYYVNVFEANHPLLQIEVTNGKITRITDFSGKSAPFIMSYFNKALDSKTAILEVEVKGAIS